MPKITKAEDKLKRGKKIVSAEDILRGLPGKDGLNGPAGRDGKDGLSGRDGLNGRDGQDGKGYVWQGDYNPSVPYKPYDTINYLGSTYVCVKDSRNNPPNASKTFWNLMAAAGSPGAAGPAGPAGGGEGGPAAWGSITGTLSSQTDLQTALDGKAALVHTHAISDVTNLQTTLDGKASTVHTHIISDVTGLQTALDGKQVAGSYAAAVHTHTISDVTGLQTALDGKQATLVSATNIKTVNGSSLLGSGDLTVGGAATWGSITGTLSTQTDLQSALNAKVDDSQISAFGLTLVDDVDAAAARTTLGLGTLATQSGTFSGTSSGTNTGDQNVFSTVAVSGQSNVVADTTSDTLTLAAGSGISITTDASTDTVTISNSAPDHTVSLAQAGTVTITVTYPTFTITGASTNLTYTASTRLLESSTGTDVTLPLVTTTNAGLAPASGGGTTNFLRADATWAAPATDLTYTASTRLLASSTGTDATLPLFTSTEAGLTPLSGGGTANFLRADGTWAAPPAGGSLALDDLTDVTITSAAEGQVLVRGAAGWENDTFMTVTLGPFYINDLPGTATTDATLGYFNTATALSRNANEIKMQTAGRIVGVMVTSDAARTAGTATVAVEVNNGTQAFNGGAVVLNATNTTSNSSFVAWGSGVSFNAGDTLGCEVTTSGWTPITANLSLWIVVMLKF